MRSEAECIKNNFKFIISTTSGYICKQTTNPFNEKTEFAALHGAIHDLKNLKQKFEQTKILKLYKYIIKMAL